MKGKVNKEILQELATFGKWFSVKCKESYNVKVSYKETEVGSFKEYLVCNLAVSLRGAFWPEKYVDIVKVYEDYYDTDGDVLLDYKDMKSVLEVFGKEYQDWREGNNEN